MRENLPGEIWRPVVGYEGRYEVSDHGRVYSLLTQKILRSECATEKYPRVSLRRSGKALRERVHVLVAAAFIGPRPPGLVINHKDGNKFNNHLSNLEYVTVSGNSVHALQTGLRIPLLGEESGRALISNEDVARIWNLFFEDEIPATRIAEEYGLGTKAVQMILDGTNWRSLTRTFRQYDYKDTIRRMRSRYWLSKAEYEALALRLVDHNEHVPTLAIEYNLHPSTLYRWRQRHAARETD